MPHLSDLKQETFSFRYISFYGQLKLRSWLRAWKKFYNLGTSSQDKLVFPAMRNSGALRHAAPGPRPAALKFR